VNPPDRNQLAFEKILDLEIVRVNLLLFSLYLTAYETLKSAIIDNIADSFVWETRTQTEVEANRKEFGERLSQLSLTSQEKTEILEGMFGTQETYEGQVGKYEENVGFETGLKYDARARLGLIPSCNYLHASGVLTEREIEEIKELREHRNRIAHGLPELLTSKGFGVDPSRLQRIRELIIKVEMFWARFHISIEYPEIYDVPDEDIFSGRVVLIDQILRAVVEYLEKVGQAA